MLSVTKLMLEVIAFVEKQKNSNFNMRLRYFVHFYCLTGKKVKRYAVLFLFEEPQFKVKSQRALLSPSLPAREVFFHLISFLTQKLKFIQKFLGSL
jgi:hypothetical protein